MAVITPTSIIRDNIGSLTLFTANCTAVSSGDYLNVPNSPTFYFASVTSCGATGNSAVVRFANAASSLTISFSATAMNMQIVYGVEA